MLAYAAHRPIVAQRRSSPNAMLVVIAAHVALIAVVMSAKMDLPGRILDPPTKVDLIPAPEPPPPADPVRGPKRPLSGPTVMPNPIPLPPLPGPVLPVDPAPPGPGPAIGPSIDPVPNPPLQVIPVRRAAELLTPASELKPPYPESKLVRGEEALLRLRLTIDERGRVVAVEPVGRADRVFLDAARRHLIAHWRYRPADQDGRAVASSEVVTLRFQLDG